MLHLGFGAFKTTNVVYSITTVLLEAELKAVREL